MCLGGAPRIFLPCDYKISISDTGIPFARMEFPNQMPRADFLFILISGGFRIIGAPEHVNPRSFTNDVFCTEKCVFAHFKVLVAK